MIPILVDKQIRKAKREEQLSKRRNVCVLEEGELGPDQDDIVSSSGMSPGAGVLVPNASSPQQEIIASDYRQKKNFLNVH